MERRELTLLDEWTNLAFVGECPNLLVIIGFVSEKNTDFVGNAFDESRPELRIECVPLFGEHRRVTSNRTTYQVHRSVNWSNRNFGSTSISLEYRLNL